MGTDFRVLVTARALREFWSLLICFDAVEDYSTVSFSNRVWNKR